MHKIRFLISSALFLPWIFYLFSGVLMAKDGDTASADEPTLHVGSLLDDFVLDGVLDEAAWAEADAITKLIMVDPEEGGTPTGETMVRVLGNAGHIVFGIHLTDPHPEEMVSYSTARDSHLGHEDHLKIVLGTFPGSGTGYVFAVNPTGARYDALIARRGEGENRQWDGLWEAKTRLNTTGWTVEIRIPISTLSFEKEIPFWRFNVERRIQRLMETSRWSGARRDYRVTQIRHGGILTNLPAFELGIGLSVRPSFVAGYGRESPEHHKDYETDLSLDVTQKLGSNLMASLTVNTDFAETEVYTLRSNLTRYPLFFPEKRSFFLEGSDLFDFGLGIQQDAMPFHSRRIGLVEGEEIPILAGAKIHGHVNDTSLGALLVNTREKTGVADEAELGVVRIKQRIFEESSVGMIATTGDPFGQHDSWTAGADFTYQTSEFMGDKNFLVGIWGLTMNREEMDGGSRSAVGGKIDYPNDLWDVMFSYKRIGTDFDPSLGFVPRSGVHKYSSAVEYKPQPEWDLVRRMYYELFTTFYTDLKGNWESLRIFTAPVNWVLESGDGFEFNIVKEAENLSESFEISDNVVIPKDSYHWSRFRIKGETASKRSVSAEASLWFGPFYDGKLTTYEAELEWNPTSLVTLEVVGEKNIARLEGGTFKADIYGGRLKFNFSPDLTLSSFVQYETEEDFIGTNTRFRWDITPSSTFFLIYNYNWNKFQGDWRRESYETKIKAEYTFRF